MNPVSARLLNQQLVSPQFASPEEVVSWMGAVQGQEYRLMRWAVGMRTRKPSARAFTEAYNQGLIVRGHLFRTTWQLVSGEDWHWMLDLCRANALRGLAGWMHSNGVSIPPAEQDAVRQVFCDYLERHRIARKTDLADSLLDRGMVMEEHRLSYHIRLAEYAGLLCSGDLFPLKHSYALASRKLPPRSPVPREEALALLSRKYFRSHGPATLEDFVWWSGLNMGDCRKGLLSIQDELVQERWKGLTFWLHRDSRFRGFRRGTVTLLPSYDEYLIGYKSRHVSVHPDHSHRAHNNTGNFWPVVLLDGQVVGNWSIPGGTPQAEIFDPSAAVPENSLADQIGRYMAFSGN